MAVVDKTIGDGYALNNTDGGEQFTLRLRVDASAVNVTAADVLKLFVIPANTLVQEVVAIVRTAEGGTLTIDVGDYLIATDAEVNADGYLDGFNGNSAAAVKSNGTAAAYGNGGDGTGTFGKVYTARDSYIGALFNNTADAAVIDFMAICVKITDNEVENTY